MKKPKYVRGKENSMRQNAERFQVPAVINYRIWCSTSNRSYENISIKGRNSICERGCTRSHPPISRRVPDKSAFYDTRTPDHFHAVPLDPTQHQYTCLSSGCTGSGRRLPRSNWIVPYGFSCKKGPQAMDAYGPFGTLAIMPSAWRRTSARASRRPALTAPYNRYR